MESLLVLLAQSADAVETATKNAERLKTDIRFPGLGIVIRELGSYFTVFGLRIAYYGVTIGLAMVLGYLSRTAWRRRPTRTVTCILILRSSP